MLKNCNRHAMYMTIGIIITAAILFAGSLRYRTIAAREQCIKNQENIDAAAGNWMWDLHKSLDDRPSWEELRPYLRRQDLPVCPCGGTYIIGRVTDPARCSIREHNESFPPSAKV